MKQLIQSAIGAFGYHLVAKKPLLRSAALDRCLTALKKLGFDPAHIIDVGANHGYWTRDALVHFPKSAYTMIEPQAHLKSEVDDLLQTHGNMKWIHAGAGDVNKTMLFTIASQDDSSSFLPTSEQATEENLKQVEVPMVTLNKVVATSSFPMPELVKIDAEGFDLKVIDGASDLMGKTEVFFVEAAVCAPGIENRLAEMIIKMDQLGYVPFDITDLNRSPRQGVLWLLEVVFLKKSSDLLANISPHY